MRFYPIAQIRKYKSASGIGPFKLGHVAQFRRINSAREHPAAGGRCCSIGGVTTNTSNTTNTLRFAAIIYSSPLLCGRRRRSMPEVAERGSSQGWWRGIMESSAHGIRAARNHQ